MTGSSSGRSTPQFETILYEVDAEDHVATITLNRPEVLNAFDRQMCEELRDAWHVVKADDRVNTVVLRAAGERAFSAGLDTSKSFGSPISVEPRRPRRAPEPEVAEVLEAGGLRGARDVHRARSTS